MEYLGKFHNILPRGNGDVKMSKCLWTEGQADAVRSTHEIDNLSCSVLL